MLQFNARAGGGPGASTTLEDDDGLPFAADPVFDEPFCGIEAA